MVRRQSWWISSELRTDEDGLTGCPVRQKGYKNIKNNNRFKESFWFIELKMLAAKINLSPLPYLDFDHVEYMYNCTCICSRGV